MLAERLQELRQEYDKGQTRLVALDHERQQLQETMLRISGAIQVVEELLAQEIESAQMQKVESPRNEH